MSKRRAGDHETADYLEIGLLAAFAVIGTPLGAISLLRLAKLYGALCRSRTTAGGQHQSPAAKTAFVLLKIQLNGVGLLLLLLYCPLRLFWLANGGRAGGFGTHHLLCRLVHFCWRLAFHLYAYLTAGIAFFALVVTRKLAAALAPDANRTALFAHQAFAGFVKRVVVAVWLMSVVTAIPQLFVWTAGPTSSGCENVWRQRRVGGAANDTTTLFVEYFEQASMFWLPLLLCLVCYGWLLAVSLRHSGVAASLIPSRALSNRRSSDGRPKPAAAALLTAPSTSSAAVGHQSNLELRRLSDRPLPSTSETRKRSSLVGVREDLVARRLSRQLIGSHAAPLLRRRANSLAAGTVPRCSLQWRSNVCRTCLLVALLFAVCWLPYHVAALPTFGRRHDDVSKLIRVLRTLLVLPAVSTPVLHGFTSV